MSTTTYPGAVTKFTVQRKSVTAGTNPTYGGFQNVATGVSIVMQDASGIIADARGALIFNAQYKGSTFPDAPVQLGDVLLDENEQNADGSPVAYNVQGRSLGAFSMQLHLKRSITGV